MVQRKDLLHLSFYEKSPYLGSDGPLRYRIEKSEEGEDDAKKKVMKVTIWPGPFSFDKTPEEKMSSVNFEFKEEALDEIAKWISEKSSEMKES
ncbi:MAG: hypothetical protein DUD27_05480 [Lachnospiraceae bacterium]|uniref:GNAT family acetyltransferase n=1 Tax=Candidatus Weimeria bifida TaxID=2599074 RepID=A0A6N7IWY6_9FIRM|nr:hypothetical protein [Candidatus Weimeria bifida]RRF96242.1 MAG: hypothetical protein DUD27_05480 [Lachnospiraceae bacterium]